MDSAKNTFTIRDHNGGMWCQVSWPGSVV